MPGLCDNHVHPVIGDYTPRQRQFDFIDSSLHGGVTTMLSAGEPHTPGRPTDPAGVKALAILAHKSFANLRPSGVKVHAGAVMLEPGLTEDDFTEMAAAGVRLVAEIGISGVKDPDEAAAMTRWAQAGGMRVMVHTGGASIPGSGVIGADFVVTVQPDVAGHVNGGPTALPLSDVARILDETSARIELVHNGNVKAAGGSGPARGRKGRTASGGHRHRQPGRFRSPATGNPPGDVLGGRRLVTSLRKSRWRWRPAISPPFTASTPG